MKMVAFGLKFNWNLSEAIIGSDNGLSPGRHQAINWTNAGRLLTESLDFSEIFIEIHIFFIHETLFENVVWEMTAILLRPQCVKYWIHCNMSESLSPKMYRHGTGLPFMTFLYRKRCSINQSINQSVHPSIHPSIHQSINQSINQPINQSISQSSVHLLPSCWSYACFISLLSWFLHPGTLMGLTNTFATIPGILGPEVVGWLTQHDVSLIYISKSNWQ